MRVILFILLCLFASILTVSAQDGNTAEIHLILSMKEMALVDFQGGSRINSDGSQTAEQKISYSTKDEIWLNYSSIVSEESSRSISAFISSRSSNAPSDLKIRLRVSDDAGQGQGKIGIPTGEITLSSSPQEIITGIGSCYTGRGISKGHQLEFEFPTTDDDFWVGVTYTIAASE